MNKSINILILISDNKIPISCLLSFKMSNRKSRIVGSKLNFEPDESRIIQSQELLKK